MAKGERLPWRRDWSKEPGAWKLFLVWGVSFLIFGVVYLGSGRWIGIFYCLLAVVQLAVSRLAFVRRRRTRVDRQTD